MRSYETPDASGNSQQPMTSHHHSSPQQQRRPGLHRTGAVGGRGVSPLSPPPSFLSNYPESEQSSSTTITPTKTAVRRANTSRQPSMSPEPDLVFPTLIISPRATPEPDFGSREGSPALTDVGRGSSPEAEVEEEYQKNEREEWNARSRSSSPEQTMRPPPLPRQDSHTSPLRDLSRPEINSRSPSRLRRNDSASSSTGSFDMIASYQSVLPADARRNSIAKETQDRRGSLESPRKQQYKAATFTPNAGLTKPISPSFIRDYASAEDSGPAKSRDRVKYSPRTGGRASGYFPNGSTGSLRKRQEREMFVEEENEELHEHLQGHSIEGMIASDPTASMDSGMPSYFEQNYRQHEASGLRFDPRPGGCCRTPSIDLDNNDSVSEERKQKDSISTVYIQEVSSQVNWVLRVAKKPLVTITLVGAILFGFSCLISGASILSTDRRFTIANSTPLGGTVDFPTLMNIESAFERVVDSSAGGSELARSLKNSEMAVSDLSTVVKHSNLKCKENLSARLERFADDARTNVRGLISFASEVGGVLDQLLSVNQYALRELSTLQTLPPGTYRRTWFLEMFFPRNPSVVFQSRVAEIFDSAVEVLESNLRTLIASGQNIENNLDDLALQHKPIYDEIIREISDIRKASAEAAMSNLWNYFGGGNARANFRDNEQLLSDIRHYQDRARAYVEITLLELRRMTNELDNLRRRVAEPLLVGERANLDVQVEAVHGAVKALLMKRQNREDRQRQWNRIILEREIRESDRPVGYVEGHGVR